MNTRTHRKGTRFKSDFGVGGNKRLAAAACDPNIREYGLLKYAKLQECKRSKAFEKSVQNNWKEKKVKKQYLVHKPVHKDTFAVPEPDDFIEGEDEEMYEEYCG